MALAFSSTTHKVDHGTGTHLDSTNPFTVLVLTLITSTATDQRWFQKGTGANAWLFGIDSVLGRLEVSMGRVTQTATATSAFANFANWGTNKWVWVAATVDSGTAANSKLYCGDLTHALAEPSGYDVQRTGSGTVGNNTGTQFCAGNRTAGSTNIVGSLAALFYFSGIVSLSDLIQFQFGLKFNQRPLLWCYYGFPGTGSQNDYSGNAASGTVTGATVTDHPAIRSPWTQIQWKRKAPSTAHVVSVGQVTETDLAQALARIKLKAVGLNTETDLAQAITRVKLKALGINTETDLAQAFTRLKSKTLGLNTETDLAQPITRPKFIALGLNSETDLSQALTRLKTKALGLNTETDLAQAFTTAKRKAIGLNTETDLSQALSAVLGHAVGQASETDLAQPFTSAKRKTLGLNTETDSAFAVTRGGKVILVGQVSETDSVFAIAKLKRKALGQVSETDLAQVIRAARVYHLGIATETDIAFSFRRIKTKVLGIATEIDVAIPLFQGSPDTPGLEYVCLVDRLHFASLVERLHFSSDDYQRLHFTVDEED